ncbi:MAG: AmmeMemoRadiSam system radical SAM enzyme [Methanobacteriota archaeon]
MKQEAHFWKPVKDKKVQCQLCAHTCTITEGKTGICGVRKNENGCLYTLIYGLCSSIAVDPIEKKPLYHFYPGSQVLSFGSVGCNFRCDHCQNYTISTMAPAEAHLREVSPKEAISLAKQSGCSGLSWTYNEPTIWHEYTFDTAKRAKQAGLYTVYVTNGYIQEEPLREISPYLDAMNIDVKSFSESFYKTVCKAKLKPVLEACELAKQLGIHIELTYLVIPGLNDDLKEVKQFTQWISQSLGVETPVHFSRFHPDYQMTEVKMTPLETLTSCYTTAKEAGLLFVYVGNIPSNEYENTHCPHCNTVWVERHGFTAKVIGIQDGKCTQCGTHAPLHL